MDQSRFPHSRPLTHDERRLLDKLRRRSVKRGRFGSSANRFFDLKAAMMNARGAYLIVRVLTVYIAAEDVDFVGGLEMGAVPIMGALAAVSHVEGRPISTFFVRKTARTRGDQQMVEGLGPDESLAGARVLLLDDVATSGGSLIKAADAVRTLGGEVRAALVLLDREEGARETLARLGIRLRSVFTASHFD